MKQYTTPKQTAKLIDLGFKKPKDDKGYTICELLEIIPTHIPGKLMSIHIFYDTRYPCWFVDHGPVICSSAKSLPGALGDQIIQLRNKGLI